MNSRLTLLLSLLLCSCTQNQLILDPFENGESLMIRDEEAIAAFEAIMADVASPANEYKSESSNARFFNSQDVLNTFQFTQPAIGVCRSGDKEYYYHIEKDRRGNMITDLDQGVTDYVIPRKTYKKLLDLIIAHTPVPAEYYETEAKNEGAGEEEED